MTGVQTCALPIFLLRKFAPAVDERPKNLERRRERIALSNVANGGRDPRDPVFCENLRIVVEDLRALADAPPGNPYFRAQLESVLGRLQGGCR